MKKGEVVTAHDLVESGAAWVIAYEDGTLHRTGEELELLEDKAPSALLHCDMRDNLVVITEGGQGGVIGVHQLSDEPMPAAEVVGVPSGQRVVTAFALPLGVVRTARLSLPDHAAGRGEARDAEPIWRKQFGTFSVMNVADDDAIVSIRVTQGEGEVLLATARGQTIRFAEEDVRPMGFNAGGVAGIKLVNEDVVVGADVVQPDGEVAVITEQGAGKRSSMSEFPTQGRAGQGVIGIRVDEDDAVAGLAIAGLKEEVLITTSRGKSKQVKMKVFKSLGRATGGYNVQHVVKNEVITGLIKAVERITAPEAGEPPAAEPVQMELAIEAPAKKGKAEKQPAKEVPTIKKPVAQSKKTPVTKKPAAKAKKKVALKK